MAVVQGAQQQCTTAVHAAVHSCTLGTCQVKCEGDNVCTDSGCAFAKLDVHNMRHVIRLLKQSGRRQI